MAEPARWLRQFGRDVAFGVRLLRKAPGFAASAIAIIALGIGSVTAIFSVVYGVVLKPLPFRDPDRPGQHLDGLRQRRQRRTTLSTAPTIAIGWRRITSSKTSRCCATSPTSISTGDGGEPERLLAARISANLLPVLGRVAGDRPRLHRRRRRNRQRRRGAAERRAVAAALRRRSRDRRPHDQLERRAAHGGRRDGRGLSVSRPRVPDLDAADDQSAGARAQGAGQQLHRRRAAEARRQHRTGAERDEHRSPRGSGSFMPRTQSAACAWCRCTRTCSPMSAPRST